MSFHFPKTLMVLLLCLTFVGQLLASTVMVYDMASMKGMCSQAQSNDMSKMKQVNHHMMSDSTSKESSEDCCMKACNCFTGGCSSIAALNKGMSNPFVVDLSPKITSVSSLALSQQLTSLYRPPILS